MGFFSLVSMLSLVDWAGSWTTYILSLTLMRWNAFLRYLLWLDMTWTFCTYKLQLPICWFEQHYTYVVLTY